jgi:hypothetical protein
MLLFCPISDSYTQEIVKQTYIFQKFKKRRNLNELSFQIASIKLHCSVRYETVSHFFFHTVRGDATFVKFRRNDLRG